MFALLTQVVSNGWVAMFDWFTGIAPRFDERKTAAAAAFFLKAAGGEMPFIRLLKLLYMADRESWATMERPISGDQYVSMNNGPVLSDTYNMLKAQNEGNQPPGPWVEHVERSGNSAKLLKTSDYGPLSKAELKILQKVHDDWKSTGTWEMIDRLHKTLPEWTNPKGTSLPISPETILKHVGKSEEIKAIRKEMEEWNKFQRLLGSA